MHKKVALSITAIIKKHLKDKGITQTYLAETLKESPQNLANKLKKNDLDTDYVRRISLALHYNFFQELSRQLKSELPENAGLQGIAKPDLQEAGVPYVKQEQYIRLLEENIQLHRELKQSWQAGQTGSGINDAS